MNKKTKTMYVVLPGGFGGGATIFSTYEYEDNSGHENNPIPASDQRAAGVTQQNVENRNWTQAVVRLPEAFHRTVWLPLSRQVQKFGTAA